MFTAKRTIFTSFYVYFSKIHCFCVECQQFVGQQFANACYVFQCFGGLDCAQHSRNCAQHSRLRASGNRIWWRRCFKHATVASVSRNVCERLPLKTEYSTVAKRFSCHYARIVNEKFHREIIGSVNHKIVVFYNVESVACP